MWDLKILNKVATNIQRQLSWVGGVGSRDVVVLERGRRYTTLVMVIELKLCT